MPEAPATITRAVITGTAATVTGATTAATGTGAAIATTTATAGAGTAPPPKISHAEAARENADKRGCICYVQNTSLTSLADIWKEYKYGINGGYSLEWLEANERYWRSYSQGNIAFCRRSGIYYRMDQLIADGLTEEAALSELQAMLDAHESEKNKLDLKGFSEMLRKKYSLKPKGKGKGRKRKRGKDDSTNQGAGTGDV